MAPNEATAVVANPEPELERLPDGAPPKMQRAFKRRGGWQRKLDKAAEQIVRLEADRNLFRRIVNLAAERLGPVEMQEIINQVRSNR